MAFRFSLRTALYILTAAALFSLVLRQATRGEAWAIGVTLAAASLVAVFLMHALWYLVVRLGGLVLGDRRSGASSSKES